MGVYPFMFGCIQDFQPVVDAIIEVGGLSSCAQKSRLLT